MIDSSAVVVVDCLGKFAVLIISFLHKERRKCLSNRTGSETKVGDPVTTRHRKFLAFYLCYMLSHVAFRVTKV